MSPRHANPELADRRRDALVKAGYAEILEKGIQGTGRKKYEISDLSADWDIPGYVLIPDRREAIRRAIQSARPGDMVLLAGKGHEDYQILGNKKIHFDDSEEAEEALARIRRERDR